MPKRPRARDLDLFLGWLPTGPLNAITDVGSVMVGQTTLIHGEGALQPGLGPVRTGVTAILPHPGNLFQDKVTAAVHTINGFGKTVGFEQVRELGSIETPILLTNTLNVGLVADACTAYMLENNPEIGVTTGGVNPVVGECNDGYLNDIRGRHVRAEHVFSAIQNAKSGPVEEGNCGAGTGTALFGYKGGIGTSSRVIPQKLGGFTLGALVQTNFGRMQDLLLGGLPAGVEADAGLGKPGDGSIMIVLATDAPCSSRQLERLAHRVPFALGRVGSAGASGSGDFVIAFSTTRRKLHFPPAALKEQTEITRESEVLSALFQAVIEATAEAILNALFQGKTLTGRDGNTLEQFHI
jgi:D-aminopeptidase